MAKKGGERKDAPQRNKRTAMETARLARDDILSGMSIADAVNKYGYRDKRQLSLSIAWTSKYGEAVQAAQSKGALKDV